MNKNENIDDMITKFTKITSGLTSLSDEIDNNKKVSKVIYTLPPSWEMKSTTLKKLNDKEEIELIGLIGNLKTLRWKEKLEKRIHPKRRNFLPSSLHLPSPTKMKKKKMMKIFSS